MTSYFTPDRPLAEALERMRIAHITGNRQEEASARIDAMDAARTTDRRTPASDAQKPAGNQQTSQS